MSISIRLAMEVLPRCFIYSNFRRIYLMPEQFQLAFWICIWYHPPTYLPFSLGLAREPSSYRVCRTRTYFLPSVAPHLPSLAPCNPRPQATTVLMQPKRGNYAPLQRHRRWRWLLYVGATIATISPSLGAYLPSGTLAPCLIERGR